MHAGEDIFQGLLRLLLGDVRTLFDLIFTYRRPVSEANIRAAATILRRWIVDGDAPRINVGLADPFQFHTLDNSAIVAQIAKKSRLDFFLTGGVMMNEQPVQGIGHSPLGIEENDVLSLLPMPVTCLSLKAFANQKRIYFMGSWFTLEQIIRYVANKLGGNHYDQARDGFYQKLDDVSRFIRYGGPRHYNASSKLYLVLEPSSNEIIDGVHIEIIAAAASFIQMSVGQSPIVQLSNTKPRFFCRDRWRRKKPSIADFALRDDS